MKKQMAMKYLSVVFLMMAVVLPVIASAQTQTTNPTGFVPLVQTPGGRLDALYATQGGDLSGFVNSLFKFALTIGAIGAVLRLAYAGYMYMGSDMWSNKGAAKAIISDVALGLLLLLAIYLILFQINPDILSLKALKNITPVQTGAQGACQNGQTMQANGTCG